MATHTPGPWTNHGRIKQAGLPHSAVAAKTLIARVYSEAFGDSEQEAANAHLISAAPDLLEALCLTISFFTDPAGCTPEIMRDPAKFEDFMRNVKASQDSAISKARAAIAKATGTA